MKLTKLLFATMLCIAVFATTVQASPTPSIPTPSTPWADEYIAAAIYAGLVPEDLQYNYTQPITRAEFSALAVRLYEIIVGEITGRTTFADTTDVNVEKMAYLGVVTGVGNNMFAPTTTLTREQAATMLFRLLNAMELDFVAPAVAASFYDMYQVSEWAHTPVHNMFALRIMGGVGHNLFDPQGAYTREQSIATILRLYKLATPRQLIPVGSPDPLPPPQTGTNMDVTPPLPFEVGTVTAFVNGEEHMPYEHTSHITMFTDGGLMSGTGLRLSLEAISSQLTAIQFAEDFEIVIYGDYASSFSFSLYCENFEPVYSFEGEFTPPEDSGTFFVIVDVMWRNDANEPYVMETTYMRYVFKIIA